MTYIEKMIKHFQQKKKLVKRTISPDDLFTQIQVENKLEKKNEERKEYTYINEYELVYSEKLVKYDNQQLLECKQIQFTPSGKITGISAGFFQIKILNHCIEENGMVVQSQQKIISLQLQLRLKMADGKSQNVFEYQVDEGDNAALEELNKGRARFTVSLESNLNPPSKLIVEYPQKTRDHGLVQGSLILI